MRSKINKELAQKRPGYGHLVPVQCEVVQFDIFNKKIQIDGSNLYNLRKAFLFLQLNAYDLKDNLTSYEYSNIF